LSRRISRREIPSATATAWRRAGRTQFAIRMWTARTSDSINVPNNALKREARNAGRRSQRRECTGHRCNRRGQAAVGDSGKAERNAGIVTVEIIDARRLDS
jgi:hypothetical protein